MILWLYDTCKVNLYSKAYAESCALSSFIEFRGCSSRKHNKIKLCTNLSLNNKPTVVITIFIACCS